MWKETLPESCPPEDAVKLNQETYRILKKSLPSPDDFLPYAKLYPNNQRYQELCKAHALSSFDTEVNAKKALTASIKRGNKIGDYLAKIKITDSVGVNILTKKNGHISTWLFSSDKSYNENNCYDICKVDEN